MIMVVMNYDPPIRSLKERGARARSPLTSSSVKRHKAKTVKKYILESGPVKIGLDFVFFKRVPKVTLKFFHCGRGTVWQATGKPRSKVF